jgi:hypothetical protein
MFPDAVFAIVLAPRFAGASCKSAAVRMNFDGGKWRAHANTRDGVSGFMIGGAFQARL